MKYFAFILAFVVLALSVNPCADGFADGQMHKSEMVHAQGDSDHNDDADHCSPFCTCQCCQSTVLVSAIKIEFIATDLTIRRIDFTPSLERIDPFDYFIPPKA